MNLSLEQADVIARCNREDVAISAIEVLPSGGTHLVTVTGDGAAIMRRVLAKNIIEGHVKRFNYMQARQVQRSDPAPEQPNAPWRKAPSR